MKRYDMIRPEDADTLTREDLIAMYNDAVEEIWDLSRRCQQLLEENDLLWDDYEDLSDQLYR